MPGIPGPPGLPTTGSGDTTGTGAPVTVSIPTPQPGTPSADTGAASSPSQSGNRQQPAGAGSTGAAGREKTDDEILAEALDALKNRRAPAQPGEGGAGSAPQTAAQGSATPGQTATHGSATPGQGAAQGPATTDAEKKQALGRELEAGFAEFDQLILSEQQAGRELEGQGGFSGDDDLFPEDDPGQGPAGEPLQTAMVDTDPASVEGKLDIPTHSTSQVPPDLADARDDDIIARQLREAAMKEKDPELREKLWDEYRKYKRDLR